MEMPELPGFAEIALENKKILAATAVVAIVAVALLLFAQPAMVDEKYTVSFGKAVFSKRVMITATTHLEELAVNNGQEFFLVTIVPKGLAENYYDIKGLEHEAKMDILIGDPVLKFSQQPGKKFQASIGLNKGNQDICTINILFPNSYFNSLTETELEELKAELAEYGQMALSCSQAFEMEKELAASLDAVFLQAGLEGRERQNTAFLGESLNSKVLEALKKNKKKVQRDAPAAWPAAAGLNQRVLAALRNTRAKMPSGGIARSSTEIKIFFEDSEESTEEKGLAEARNFYGFLRDKSPINLTVSSEISESYYYGYLVYPEKVFDAKKEKTGFEKPKVEIRGISTEFFGINVSGEEQPYLLEISYRAKQGSIPQKTSGELYITYGDVWPAAPIIIPINIWLNPCKEIAEDTRDNAATFEALLSCYDAEIGKAKAAYAAVLTGAKENASKKQEELSKNSRVIFISPARLSGIMDRFKANFDFSEIHDGIKQAMAITVQDELELQETTELREAVDAIAEAKMSGTITNAITEELGLCSALQPEIEKLPDSQKKAGLQKAVEAGKAVLPKAERKFAAERELLADPFRQSNREAFINAVVELEKATVLNDPTALEERAKESAPGQKQAYENLRSLVQKRAMYEHEMVPTNDIDMQIDAQFAETRNSIRADLEKQFGTQEQLVKRLEAELSDLDARIAYLDDAEPKWYGYFNPLVAIGVPFEALGDLIFDQEVSIDRERAKEKIQTQKAELAIQKDGVGQVVKELKQGLSLFEIYESANSIVSPKGTGLERTKVQEAFYSNSALRGELRKQWFAANLAFVPNIAEANLFYNTAHSLEVERDSLLAIEILLEAENSEIAGGRSWREASLVNTVKSIVEGVSGTAGERASLKYSMRNERLGIEKILLQLHAGIPLLEIEEANRQRTAKFVLEKGIPKVISSDITLNVKEWHHDLQKWEIEVFFKGIESGAVWAGLGQATGVHKVPGLAIKPEKWAGNDVEVSVYYDNERMEKGYTNMDLLIPERGVEKTGRGNVFVAVDRIEFEGLGKQVLSFDEKRNSYNYGEPVYIAKTRALFFENALGLSRQQLLEKIEKSDWWIQDKLGSLKEEVEEKGGSTDLIEISFLVYFEKRAEGSLAVKYPGRLKYVTNAGFKYDYVATGMEHRFASSVFPGLGFEARIVSPHPINGPHELKYTEYSDDLVKKMGEAQQIVQDKRGNDFEGFLVVDDTGKGGSLSIEWVEYISPSPDPGFWAKGYSIYRDGVEIAKDITATSLEDSGLENGRAYSYQVKALNKDNRVIAQSPVVADIPHSKPKIDYQVSVALNNPTVDSLVKQRKLLLKEGKIPDAEAAEMAYKIANRYEKYSLWEEAFASYRQIEKAYPAAPHGALAQKKALQMEGMLGIKKFGAFLDKLTSLESGVVFAVTWGVGTLVSAGAKAVHLTRAARTAALAETQPVANAGRLLAGATNAAKWARLKAVLNTPLDDLIAQGIARPILAYKNWRLGKAFASAREAAAKIAETGVVWKPASVEVSAATPETAQIAGTNINVWATDKGFLYCSGKGFVAVSNNPEMLGQALQSARKFNRAMQYLEKNGRVPAGSANTSQAMQEIFEHAAANSRAAVPTTTEIVPAIQTEQQALSLLGESLAPISLPITPTISLARRLPVISAFDLVAGRNGVLAESLADVSYAASGTSIPLKEFPMPVALGSGAPHVETVGGTQTVVSESSFGSLEKALQALDAYYDGSQLTRNLVAAVGARRGIVSEQGLRELYRHWFAEPGPAGDVGYVRSDSLGCVSMDACYQSSVDKIGFRYFRTGTNEMRDYASQVLGMKDAYTAAGDAVSVLVSGNLLQATPHELWHAFWHKSLLAEERGALIGYVTWSLERHPVLEASEADWAASLQETGFDVFTGETAERVNKAYHGLAPGRLAEEVFAHKLDTCRAMLEGSGFSALPFTYPVTSRDLALFRDFGILTNRQYASLMEDPLVVSSLWGKIAMPEELKPGVMREFEPLSRTSMTTSGKAWVTGSFEKAGKQGAKNGYYDPVGNEVYIEIERTLAEPLPGLSPEQSLRAVAGRELAGQWYASLPKEAQVEILASMEANMDFGQMQAGYGSAWKESGFIVNDWDITSSMLDVREAFETGEKIRGFKAVRVVPLPDGTYLVVNRLASDIIASNAEAVGGGSAVTLGKYPLPGPVSKALAKHGFSADALNQTVGELVNWVRNIPGYGVYFNQVSPGAGGIVTPGQCSCIVNIPVQGNEAIIYLSPQPGLDQLVRVETVKDAGGAAASTRATVNTAAGENVTQVVIGNVQDALHQVQMPALGASPIKVAGQHGIQIAVVDFRALDVVRIEQGTRELPADAFEVSRFTQGGQRMLQIKANTLEGKAIDLVGQEQASTADNPAPAE